MFQTPNTRPEPQLRRSRIKDYIPDDNDYILQQWLDDWRWYTCEEVFGKASVRYFGCSNVMSDTTFERICDAAHHGLIRSVKDLYKETRWHLTGRYGQIVVDAIKDAIPAVPPPELHPATTPKPRKCSLCGEPGHTSERHGTLLYLHLIDSIERSVTCSKYASSTANRAEKPGRSTGMASPSNFSNVAFRVEQSSGDPHPPHPTVHYSRMRL